MIEADHPAQLARAPRTLSPTIFEFYLTVERPATWRSSDRHAAGTTTAGDVRQMTAVVGAEKCAHVQTGSAAAG